MSASGGPQEHEAGGGGLNLPVNGYFVRRLRLLMSIMMGVSMWISLYIRTIVE